MSRAFLLRRQERPSIFEHVKAHVREDTAGLTAGGEELPDEETFSEGGISFAPGALEGAFIRYAEPSDGPTDARLGAFLPRHPERLYPGMREIFLRSVDRDEAEVVLV
jgi:hypothetical protein